MKNIDRLGLSLISGSLLAIATAALPAITPRAESAQNLPRGGAELQSVSGTISTVARDSFTLVTAASAPNPPGMQAVQVDDTTRTMMFVIDQNTTIDGKLKIGASADVVYRQDSGNNMAVSVTVGSK